MTIRSLNRVIVAIALWMISEQALTESASLMVMNGHKLNDACEEKDTMHWKSVSGVMYVVGVIEGLELTERTFKEAFKQDVNAALWCAADGSLTTEQVYKVVCNYLSEHPEFWGYGAAQSVQMAMADAFPCSKE